MKQLILAGAIAALSGTALAAGAFDGPFVQLGIGGSGTSTKISGTDSSFDGSSSQGSFNGLVSAGWSQSIGTEGFNLGANLFYVIGNQNAGQKNNTYGVEGSGWTASVTESGQSTLKNTFGISVEPGWNFTESTLGYVKLAWVNSRLDGNLNMSYTCPACTTTSGSASESSTKTINGFGYGLGVKQLVTKNIFVGVDLMGVTYGSANYDGGMSAKPSQFLGFASVGYKF